jgi:hypothetical protein
MDLFVVPTLAFELLYADCRGVSLGARSSEGQTPRVTASEAAA